jgi:hypothetical protein
MQLLPTLAWAFQMVASIAWFISLFFYDSWEEGDAFQMTAASAWTVSNLFALPDIIFSDAATSSASAAKAETEPTTA